MADSAPVAEDEKRPTTPDEKTGLLDGKAGGAKVLEVGSVEEKALPLEIDDDGALEKGGPIDVFDAQRIGYLMQYFAVGFVMGAMPSTMYGVFICYLNVPAYVNASASTLVNLPWSFKILYALVSDSLPIAGRRRKPYMCLGWTVCFLALMALWLSPLPIPYYCQDQETGEYDVKKVCNADASTAGGHYAWLMAIASAGYVMADVASDALTVTYARREPLAQRGNTQTIAYMVRQVGSVLSLILVGFGMNGPEYNGTFRHGLSFNTICLIVAVPTAAMIPVSWILVDEPESDEKTSISAYCGNAYNLLKSGAMFEVAIYLFLSGAVGGISTTAGAEITRIWAGVQNLQQQLFSIASNLLFGFGLWLMKTYFLNKSWRWTLVITFIIVNLLDAPFTFCTIFNVIRNQYFFLDDTLLLALPSAASFVVGTYVIVELAEPGQEGLTYGLLTTISNLGGPMSTALSNQIFGMWRPSLSEPANYVEDTVAFRWEVANSYFISYVFGAAAFLLLPLLPDQKNDTQERKRARPRSSWFAIGLIVPIFLSMTYSTVVTCLTMNPSTQCLEIAGGEGCGAQTTLVDNSPASLGVGNLTRFP